MPETQQQTKRMNLVQLTFIVAVNMMGSGIIMLPTNMAKVGAISLLSWMVTALGSMAIAYGFAQAGLFNQRPGGMSAYAEDAYGKSGYFLVFFLYFLSLAIGNVAIAISAVGYLAAFLPWLSSTPVATCIGVIALLWLTTVANFGGPSWTGRIGSVTVWGVIIPVGLLSLIGWFWFKPATFAAAWNPQGLSLLQGMGSSIALTLWAFLGMESAAQNSAAVENPKRNVPLACMFGTLGAAVIYILSTTVIQGIVPERGAGEVDRPVRPRLRAHVQPDRRLHHHGAGRHRLSRFAAGLAIHDRTDREVGGGRTHVPGFLFEGEPPGRADRRDDRPRDRPDPCLALSTISPDPERAVPVLVNLAVVTNVVPYIIALSALMVMMQAAKVSPKRSIGGTWRGSGCDALQRLRDLRLRQGRGARRHAGDRTYFCHLGLPRATLYANRIAMSEQAKQLEWAWTERSEGRSKMQCARARRPHGAAVEFSFATFAVLAAVLDTAHVGPPASAATLDRVRQAGKITLGYRADARPFPFATNSGQCGGVFRRVVPKNRRADEGRARALHAGRGVESRNGRGPIPCREENKIDLLCGVDETLSTAKGRRFLNSDLSGGIGALLRADAPAGLQEVLLGRQSSAPIWRGSPAQVIEKQVFSVVAGTPSEAWLARQLDKFQLTAKVIPVDGYDAGIRRVVDRSANVFFADRSILLDAATRSPSAGDLTVLDRLFTYGPLALALARGDEDFRLLVDKTLSQFFKSENFHGLYVKWFGQPGESAVMFFRLSALPE